MQYNYNFHFHHQLVDPSQMLGGFESFYYRRNVHNGSWFGNPNIKGFLLFSKTLMGER